MNKFMRMLVFFDVPVKTAAERRRYSDFRRFLLNDGYHMLQYSVYTRICNGFDSVLKHKVRLKNNLPDNGSVRLLVLTEKQFDAMEVLVGSYHDDELVSSCEQLSIF